MTLEILQLLLLIIIANGSPIMFRLFLGERFNNPVDLGLYLPDGYPLFGLSKTWRGIVAALVVTPLAAYLLGYPFLTGFQVAMYVVVGDLFSSFVKRRLHMKSSSMAPLLDQVPESALPAYMMSDVFKLDNLSVFLLVLIFIFVELLLSYFLFCIGVRRRPY